MTYQRITVFVASSSYFSFMNQYSLGGSFPFPIVQVQVIFVSHSYQTWFTWLSRNWCLCVWVAWLCDHEVRITSYLQQGKKISELILPSDSILLAYMGLLKGNKSDPIIFSDANLVITWSCNPYAKTPIPRKLSKSGLVRVWHKDNLYLGTSTIGNGDTHPTNIDSRTRSIRMTPRRQLFFDKLFSVL